jgi:ribosomal protein S18 acetylase RimI-like enzyme
VDDGALRSRAWGTVAEEQRLFGGHVPGARVVEGEGWVASIVPSAADSPLLNTIVPLEEGAGPRAVKALETAFGDARWGVWAQRSEEAGLRRAGLQCNLAPWRLMAAPLDELAPGPAEGQLTGDLALVGRVNDVAYGLEDGRLEQHFAPLPPERVQGYRLARDGRTDAVAAAVLNGDDAGFLFVATIPTARRRGAAAALMRWAIEDVGRRGAVTASLLATSMGQGLYRSLGFRDLGTARLWER